MDRLRAFEIFTTLAAKGGFGRAAMALNTSPANVTRYIADLEAYLGTRLINRTSRRLSLTEAGVALNERLRSILSEVSEAEAEATISAARAQGRLRINAPLTFGIRYLAPLWPGFCKRHPGVELDISLSDRVVDIVEEGYDMAIRISNRGPQTHIAKKLAVSHNLIVAAPSYTERHGTPQNPAGLENHPAIAYSPSSMEDEWVLAGPNSARHRVRMRSVMRSNNGDTIRQAALAGIGLAWLPTFLINDDLRAGRLCILLPEYKLPDIDILAIYASRRHLSAKVRLMVDYLAAAMREIDFDIP